MDTKTLKDLVVAELRELLSLEKEVLKALPPLAKAAHTGELRETLLARGREGKEQVHQLESALHILHGKKSALTASGLSGLLDSYTKTLMEYPAGNLRDAALLAGMERIEAYKAAAYTSVRDFVKLLGEDEAVKLLEQTLATSDLTSKKFAQIAIQVNAEAFVDSNSPDCFLKKD